MTTCIFKKTQSGSYTEFSISNHARFARYGKDIVCSAISMLTINTINALEELCGLIFETESDEQTGYIRCRFSGDLNEKEILLLDALVLGVTSIEKQYGKKYCTVKIEEV